MKKLLKMIYNLLPFKRQFFSALRIFWTPPEFIYRHLHFHGWYWVKIDDKTKFKIFNSTIIENEIFWNGLFGRWEKESLKVWVKLAKKSRYIVDIGANNGVYALLAKAISPESSVYAFEPHPLFFKGLSENISVNDYSITALNYAVSNTDGKLSIEDYTGNSSNIEVMAITLEKFINEYQLPTIDLMKIDVETFEPEVLEGFGKYLHLFKPTLIIEILNDHVADRVTRITEGIQYDIFDIDEVGGLRKVDKLGKSTSFNYLLCTSQTSAILFS